MVKMADGRYLMARKVDIQAFFDWHSIVGKTITGIFPEDMDYGFSTMDDEEELDYSKHIMTPCCIQTDGLISVELDYGEQFEIAFSGQGPVILNTVPESQASNPAIPSNLFSLNMMFRNCLGKRVAEVSIEQHDQKMIFPCYCGIDMSAEDEGVCGIRLVLEDESCLVFSGSCDWNQMELLNNRGESMYVPMSWLKPGGSEE